MRRIGLWSIVLLVLLVLGSLLVFGSGFLRSRGVSSFLFNQRWSIPGNIWHHHGSNFRWGLPIIGVLGGLVFLLLPVSLLALLIGGIYLVIQSTRKNTQHKDAQPITKCENCGKDVESRWVVCPYCGERLSED